MIDATLIQICMALLLMTTVGLQIAKKNQSEVMLYAAQSFATVVLIVGSALETHSFTLYAIALVVLIAKVIMAPVFFVRLINRHKLKFTASTYANTPLSLAIVVAMLLLAQSKTLEPLAMIVPAHHTYLALTLATILISIFLMVNRKGVLSQAIGILSVENCIVAFGILAGLEQSAALQIGILFDITMWILVATSLVSLVYRHTGSIDVTNLKHLKD